MDILHILIMEKTITQAAPETETAEMYYHRRESLHLAICLMTPLLEFLEGAVAD